MATIEHSSPTETERSLRHQHSASSSDGRALIPMWDSSDPERAPPPLPMNPQSPSISSRRGTSSAIASAHAHLAEKAREAAASAGPPLPRRDGSPDKSLVRTTHHRRMQSMQAGAVRDIGLLLENGAAGSPAPTLRSPEKQQQQQHARPSTPSRSGDSELGSRSQPSSPTPGPSLTPIVRPVARRSQQSILGENPPPQSATMLALQSRPASATPAPKEMEPEPLFTNPSHEPAESTHLPHGFQDISNQILSLTNIATSLQKDMAQLSRRSRDNAADLLSLKEVTSSRDEDIRKGLREVLTNLSEATRPDALEAFNTGLLLDNQAHNQYASSPRSRDNRPISLPRIPSPTSFSTSMEHRDLPEPPTKSSSDSSKTAAALEKISSEMGTAQEHKMLLSRLSQLSEQLSSVATAAKVEEVLSLAKQNSLQAVSAKESQQTARSGSGDELIPSGAMTQRVDALLRDQGERRSSAPAARATDLINDDFVKIIRTVKDSVAHSGGMTAEVKTLVRELRGEVLGMGREIGRKLEEHQSAGEDSSKEEIARIIDEGLEEMRGQIDELVRDHRRQSGNSVSTHATAVDYQEIYNAMRAALKDSQASQMAKPAEADLTREDVLEAVRTAWEEYNPEIDITDRSLGREEVLEYLKEGLQESLRDDEKTPGATRDEVFQAVVEGLKHFVPPQVDSAASLSRDEILDAVRECLEEFEFPVAPSAINAELSKDDMVQAVKDGLGGFEFPSTAAAVVPSSNPTEVVEQLQEMMEYMRGAFQSVSEEAKQNMAANGRDTEQLLDATKDGLERLRGDIEEYISHSAANIPNEANASSSSLNHDDIMEGIGDALDDFRDEVATIVKDSSESTKQMLDERMDTLKETVNSSMVPVTAHAGAGNNNAEVLEALKSGLESVRHEMQRPLSGNAEVLDALHDGLADLRASIDKIGDRPMDLTANDEILDALKAGLGGVRSDIDGLREECREDRAVTTMKDNAVVQAEPATDMLRHDDIKNLEVLITQLRIKVEAMVPDENNAAPKDEDVVSKDDLCRLEDMMSQVQDAVKDIKLEPQQQSDRAPASSDQASKEDVEAIETILRNTKAKLDELIDGDQSVRKEHVDSLQVLMGETKESVDSFAGKLEDLPSKGEIVAIEAAVALVSAGFDEMKQKASKDLEDPERVTKTHVDAVEAACMDIKTTLDQNLKPDLEALASGEDVQALAASLDDIKTRLDGINETNTKENEERQAEIVGVGECVNDVKTLLEEFQELAKTKLEDGANGIEALGKLLEGVSENITQNTALSDGLKELSESMKAEFEESRAGVAGANLDSEQKFETVTETLSTKIDEKVGELLAKYDEFQTAAEERATASEARDIQTEEALTGTKTVADELKTVVDTLGTAVTDSMEKMEEASKTVFDKVEDLAARSDESRAENLSEHQSTRDQIKAALDSVEGLQGQVGDYPAQTLDAVKEVLTIVGQHFEHSKGSQVDLETKLEEAKTMKAEPPLLPPVEKYDDTVMHEKLDKLVAQYNDAVVHEKLDRLVEKYDDTAVQEKLDKLVENCNDPTLQEKLDRLVTQGEGVESAFGKLDTLEQVHQQVTQTASELSAFLAGQQQLITDTNDDKRKELEETNASLERQLAQKENVESNLASLKEEEERLKASVAALKNDQDTMIRQRTRLTAEVSSLETALHIRREELQHMETRAEGLERRILEGVMDHSRVLLMSKNAKNQESMSRKRVKTAKPESAKPAETQSSGQTPKKAVPMTLAPKPKLAPPNPQNPQARRILSLSQINNNVASAGVARSQSVRTPAGGVRSIRKSSWAGGVNGSGRNSLKEGDKENVGAPGIDEEPEHFNYEEDFIPQALSTIQGSTIEGSTALGDASESDLRRSSHGTTIITDSCVDSSLVSDDDARSDYTVSTSAPMQAGAGGGNEVVVFDGA